MTAVTFPPALGGDGSTVTDDANPATGLANGGHRARFVPALQQAVAVMGGAVAQAGQKVADATAHAQGAAASAAAAAASAASALNAPGTCATSATNLTLGSGNLALVLAQANKGFVVGQWVSITDSAAPASRWLLGAITAFTPATGAMSVYVMSSKGSGNGSAWSVVAAAPVDALGGIGGVTFVTGTACAAVAGGYYVCVNALAACVVTLPANPIPGQLVIIDNATGRVDLLVARNGKRIFGLDEDHVLDLPGVFAFRFIDDTRGWRYGA